MTWTHDRRITALLRLPWTIVPEVTREGDRILRCAEIRDAVGSGADDDALIADFWESLRSSLESYVHFGDPIPLPAGQVLPWERALEPRGVVHVRVSTRSGAWEERPETGYSARAPEFVSA